MLNLEETLETTPSYIIQRDLSLKAFVYAGGVLTFIDFLRGQISEVKILQLVPGFYFFLILISFLFLVILSTGLIRVPFRVDQKRSWGTKTNNKKKALILLKLIGFVFSAGMIVILNTLIPISLDFFNSTGVKTLENTWSFGEVLALEIFLLLVLSILFQIPIFLVAVNYNEDDIRLFPNTWRSLSFGIFVLSGLITPTIDGYTQISLASAAFSLYLMVITTLTKRLYIKSNNIVSLH
jgi:hypothetical protein